MRTNRRIQIAAAVLGVISCGFVQADTFYVNGECGNDAWSGKSQVCEEPDGPKATIQAGIDAAQDRDEIVVADGTYTGEGNTNLDLGGRLITVRSAGDDPALCVIDCEEVEGVRGFHFHSGETEQAVVKGFTIQNAAPGNDQDGGGMFIVDSDPTVINCAFLGNQAGSGGFGGGLAAVNSSPTVIDCTFTGNSAGLSGGMSVGDNTTVTGCTFTGNRASHDRGGSFGGGMSASGSATVTNCVFSDNEADGAGGGMSVFDSATVTNCSFSGNSAGRGGGMFVLRSPRVTNCVFSDNTASASVESAFGGGMYIVSGSPTVESCTFIGNTVSVDSDGGGAIGGGMSIVRASPTVVNCAFNGNKAVRKGGFAGPGGGMSVGSTSTATVTNCSFTGNSVAGPSGGGMSVDSTSTAIVTNCSFGGNSAGRGGGMSVGGSTTVTNCTFSGNAADSGGGIYFFSGSSATVVNCVLWGNSSPQIRDASRRAIVRYCDVQDGWSGTGNIDEDPLFVDPDNGDLHISPGSPVIDAGNNNRVPQDITTDLDGNPRFVDDADTEDTGKGDPPIVDMGAYEFQGCTPCDTNCDGSVDLTDVDPFIELLLGGDPCADCAGDTNGDGSVDLTDVEGFIECLLG